MECLSAMNVGYFGRNNMSYTNVKLDFYSNENRLRDDYEIMAFKLQLATEKVDRLRREIENIYDAAVEHGYVKLSVNKEKEIMLVLQTTEVKE